MALFNKLFKKTKGPKNAKTINRAGGQAFEQSPNMKLASLLLTSFAQDQYYRKAETQFEELITLLSQVEPKFAAKAAIYARTQFGMRSITHVLAAELAAYASGQAWAKDFYSQIVHRPDDMLEIAAYYKSLGAKTLPNAMKKGFAKAFDRFDGYQIAKYRGQGKAVKMIDIVNMVHPIPTQKNAQALQALVDGTLKNTATWEAKLSEAGQHATTDKQKAALKKEAWASLLREGKLGYFALVRNLRNISEQAPNLIDIVCEQLTNRHKIKHSLVMPFRLLTAYKQLQNNGAVHRRMAQALEKAIEIACDNVPNLPKTLVVIDNSGSMGSPVAGSEHILCNEMGAIFGMILAKRSNADIMEFGTNARYINYQLNDSVLNFGKNFAKKNQVGHGTNFHSIFETAKKKYDRIVIFSDMQGWIGHFSPKNAFEIYKAKHQAHPYIYSFDLRGYGSLQFPQDKVFALAGFNEKVFDMMKVVEQSPQVLVESIEAIDLS